MQDAKTAKALEATLLKKYGKSTGQLGQLIRDENNAVIEWFDGEFSYGTRDGEYYVDGRGNKYRTHEEFVCGVKQMRDMRTARVTAKLEANWKVSKSDLKKLLAKRVLDGKISGDKL